MYTIFSTVYYTICLVDVKFVKYSNAYNKNESIYGHSVYQDKCSVFNVRYDASLQRAKVRTTGYSK